MKETGQETSLDHYIGAARGALSRLEHETDSSPFYVQTVLIAESGMPVARLRWDDESQEWLVTGPREADFS